MKTMIGIVLAVVCVLYAGCGNTANVKSAPKETAKKTIIEPKMELTLDKPVVENTSPAAKPAEEKALPEKEKAQAAEAKPAEETAPLEKIKLAEDTPDEENTILKD